MIETEIRKDENRNKGRDEDREGWGRGGRTFYSRTLLGVGVMVRIAQLGTLRVLLSTTWWRSMS